jgi:hypothetical protein
MLIFGVKDRNFHVYLLYIPSLCENNHTTRSRRVKLAGHVALLGEERNAYRILVRMPERKRPLARPRCRWVDNRKINHREIGRDGMNWTDLG